MKRGEELPLCREDDLIMEQLVELSVKSCGCLIVVDDQKHLLGTFTDGDLRRSLKAHGEKIFSLTVGEMCHRYVQPTLFLLSSKSEPNDHESEASIVRKCTLSTSMEQFWPIESC